MNLRLRIPHFLDKLQPSETAVLLGTAIMVGAGTGLGAVGFIEMIDLVQRLFFDQGQRLFSFLGRGLVLVIPLVGGLLAGPIIAYFAQEAKGHGVPEVMQSIALRGGRIRPRVVVAKLLASSLCIGSGGSAGREGPIVQVGAALGSTLGQWLHLSDARIRNLVACGAAAGIAATFNAPIAGVVFAMEIILGELHLGDLGNVVISALTASTIARIFLGERPAFIIPRYGVQSPWEVLLFAVLGILSGFIAVGFIRMLYWFEDRFDEWRVPQALKPGIGGMLLGALALFYPMVLGLGFIPSEEILLGIPNSQNLPHVFGSGFPVIESTLLGELSFGLLFVLILLKPLATSLTLGSGNSGGVFAPALFTGAALGGAFGHLLEFVAPGTTAGAGAYAIVGMAAVFAGAARAPFTGILIVFEMTDDYRMIIPLMAGVIISLIVSQRIERESIYTLKLARRGIRFRRGRDVDVMEAVHVKEVMVQEPVTVKTDLPVDKLAARFIETGRHGFPVLNQDDSLFGIVSLEDYRRALANKPGSLSDLKVRDIATQTVVSVYPDETVGAAMRRMAPRDLSRLPVVSRQDPRKLVGMVRRNDIVRAYELGATRRDEAHLQSSEEGIRQLSGLETVELRIERGSTCENSRLGEIAWPRDCLVAAIRHKQHTLIPHGDALLHAGDVLVVVSEAQALSRVRELCSSKKP
jgi:CIC family chloride channel protein